MTSGLRGKNNVEFQQEIEKTSMICYSKLGGRVRLQKVNHGIQYDKKGNIDLSFTLEMSYYGRTL